MRIDIAENDGDHYLIPIPSCIVLNRFAACFAPMFLAKYGVDITIKQAISFVNELNRYRHAHPEWIFVDVESSDGDKIQITF